MCRKRFIILILMFISCERNYNENSKYKEELDQKRIIRVTDGQLMDLASFKGNQIVDSLKKSSMDFASTTIGNQNGLIISAFKEEDIVKGSLYSKLFEAYMYSKEMKQVLESNVQRINMDTLLYTKPMEDSVGSLRMLVIKFSKKYLIKTLLKDKGKQNTN